jgi:hypothetical protein
MIRAMDLGMAIETATIYGPYVQRFSSGRLMAWQHMNMALLAQQMNARRQKLGIARTMRRVTIQATFADGRVLPEKRPPFFGMAGVTHIIHGKIHEHPTPLPAMRIVAGRAADLHVAKLGAKQVGGALKKIFSPLNVATETRFLDRRGDQQTFGYPGVQDLRDFCIRLVSELDCHPLNQFGVVNAVTRQAAHVARVVLTALPVEMAAIPRVALQARLIRCDISQLGGIAYIAFAGGLRTCFGMLVAVCVANLTLGATRIFQEFGTLAVSVEREGLYHQPMALLAILPNHRLLSSRGGLRFGRWANRFCKGKEKDDKDCRNKQRGDPRHD